MALYSDQFWKIVFSCTVFVVHFHHQFTATLKIKKTLVTFHDYGRSWNDAYLICVAGGGVLYREDSAEKKYVLSKYRASEDWMIGTSVLAWTGLHSVVQNGNFTWTYGMKDCRQIGKDIASTSWDDTHPNNDFRCGTQHRSTGKWESYDCKGLRKFICEQDLDMDCKFVQENASITDISSSQYLTQAFSSDNVSYCISLCRNTIYNNLNCWAVKHDNDSEICNLHFSEDPFLFSGFIDNESETNSSFSFIKSCYEAKVKKSSPASTKTSTSSVPDEGCENVTSADNGLLISFQSTAPTSKPVSFRSIELTSIPASSRSTQPMSASVSPQSIEPTAFSLSFKTSPRTGMSETTESTSGLKINATAFHETTVRQASISKLTDPSSSIITDLTNTGFHPTNKGLARLSCKSLAFITTVYKELLIPCLIVVLVVSN